MVRDERFDKEGVRGRILKKMKRGRERSGGSLKEIRSRFEARRAGSDKPGEKKLPTKLRAKLGGVRSRISDASTSREQDSGPRDVNGGRTGKAQDPVKKRRHRLILQEDSDDEDYEPRPVSNNKETNPSLSPVAEGRDGAREIDEDIFTPISRQVRSQGIRKSARVPKKKIMDDFEGDIPNLKGKKSGGAYGEPWADERVEKGDTGVEKEVSASEKGPSASDDDFDTLDDTFSAPEAKRARVMDKPKTHDTPAAGPVGPEKERSIQLTARQRTMQLGKDGDADVGSNLIEFPTGLSHASRRRRQKLPEAERLMRNAEAASRRKQLAEKAAKETQATAIQKILGQDSSRKRKEDRLQKQREEIEQGRKAAALEPASNSVRWKMGPEGTIVSWSGDVELPNIFSIEPARYPPAREKCAAPACTNPYKYRDSRLRLPLCSLQCYSSMQSTTAVGVHATTQVL